MAVYTRLDEPAMRRHLRPFRLGDLLEFRGIAAGTINTIYDVRTSDGHYILRILENRSARDASFEEALLSHLTEHGLAVPHMLATRRGRVLRLTERQHISVFHYLPGREIGVFEIATCHARQVGTFIGAMHEAVASFRRRRKNHFDPPSIERKLSRCRRAARTAQQRRDLDLLAREIAEFRWDPILPTGVVHGDLFVDNARFLRGQLCGVLDFEMAALGPFMYDVAVAVCDWAFQHDRLILDRAQALAAGYMTKRRASDSERRSLYPLCRFAAARFAVSRFFDFELHRRPEAERLHKDYRHFMDRVRALRKVGAKRFQEAVFS